MALTLNAVVGGFYIVLVSYTSQFLVQKRHSTPTGAQRVPPPLQSALEVCPAHSLHGTLFGGQCELWRAQLVGDESKQDPTESAATSSGGQLGWQG